MGLSQFPDQTFNSWGLPAWGQIIAIKGHAIFDDEDVLTPDDAHTIGPTQHLLLFLVFRNRYCVERFAIVDYKQCTTGPCAMYPNGAIDEFVYVYLRMVGYTADNLPELAYKTVDDRYVKIIEESSSSPRWIHDSRWAIDAVMGHATILDPATGKETLWFVVARDGFKTRVLIDPKVYSVSGGAGIVYVDALIKEYADLNKLDAKFSAVNGLGVEKVPTQSLPLLLRSPDVRKRKQPTSDVDDSGHEPVEVVTAIRIAPGTMTIAHRSVQVTDGSETSTEVVWIVSTTDHEQLFICNDVPIEIGTVLTFPYSAVNSLPPIHKKFRNIEHASIVTIYDHTKHLREVRPMTRGRCLVARVVTSDNYQCYVFVNIDRDIDIAFRRIPYLHDVIAELTHNKLSYGTNVGIDTVHQNSHILDCLLAPFRIPFPAGDAGTLSHMTTVLNRAAHESESLGHHYRDSMKALGGKYGVEAHDWQANRDFEDAAAQLGIRDPRLLADLADGMRITDIAKAALQGVKDAVREDPADTDATLAQKISTTLGDPESVKLYEAIQSLAINDDPADILQSGTAANFEKHRQSLIDFNILASHLFRVPHGGITVRTRSDKIL